MALLPLNNRFTTGGGGGGGGGGGAGTVGVCETGRVCGGGVGAVCGDLGGGGGGGCDGGGGTLGGGGGGGEGA